MSGWSTEGDFTYVAVRGASILINSFAMSGDERFLSTPNVINLVVAGAAVGRGRDGGGEKVVGGIGGIKVGGVDIVVAAFVGGGRVSGEVLRTRRILRF